MHQCPCGDYFTLDERGGYDICPVCFWEDDGLDVDKPDAHSGPNHITLREARRNFLAYGACEERFVGNVIPQRERARFRFAARQV